MSLEKGRLRKDLTDVYQYLEGGFKEDRASVMPSDRTRGSGTNLNTRKHFSCEGSQALAHIAKGDS